MTGGQTIAARTYRVHGRVQGVGFRWFTQRSAERHGIGGWVRNLPDGQVEVLAVGEPAALQSFEDDIRTGPTGAHVDGVTATDAQTPGETSGFVIR